MSVTVGDKAPNFTLRAFDKSEVSLEDYRGKNVVLLFFPLAFTGVCTTELCTMRDDQKLNFPLRSDFNKNVAQAYGSLYEDFVLDMKGVAKRSAFVIDKEGIIRYAEVLESAGDLPNFDQVKATLASLN